MNNLHQFLRMTQGCSTVALFQPWVGSGHQSGAREAALAYVTVWNRVPQHPTFSVASLKMGHMAFLLLPIPSQALLCVHLSL